MSQAYRCPRGRSAASTDATRRTARQFERLENRGIGPSPAGASETAPARQRSPRRSSTLENHATSQLSLHKSLVETQVKSIEFQLEMKRENIHQFDLRLKPDVNMDSLRME
jgi:hypothetical protein